MQPLCIFWHVEPETGVTDAWVSSHQVCMPRLGTVCLTAQNPTDGSPGLPWLTRVLRLTCSPVGRGPSLWPVFWVFTIVFIFSVLRGTSSVSMCTCLSASSPLTETPTGLKNNLKTLFVYSRHQSLVVLYSERTSVEWTICLPCFGILHGAEILRSYCLCSHCHMETWRK